LADAFARRAQALRDLRTDQDLAIQERVTDINEMALHVGRLNAEIARVKSVGDDPNDLLDERDRVLDNLAEVTGAISYLEPNGEVAVSINGHALVVGTTTFKLTTQVVNNPPPTPAGTPGQNLTQIVWADGLSFSTARGELAGLLDARDRVIPNQQMALDLTALEVANRVNGFHQTGFGLPPANATSLNFFDISGSAAGGAALALRLDSAINSATGLNHIAAASLADSPGDGSNALNIANLHTGLFLNGGAATIGGYYTASVGQAALELQTVENETADRTLVAESLDTQRQSVGGVSLDEEAAKLVQTQRAYEAAARMMTTVDEMLDKIINGMGLVGR
jgi:flagellar hook-associated protein 1 FlgK